MTTQDTPPQSGPPREDELARMRERARHLAQRSQQAVQRDVIASVVIVSIGEAQYGLPAEWIVEITRTPPIMPLPGLPSWLPGLVVVRGELVSTIDLPDWSPTQGDDQRALRLMALLRHRDGRSLGLLLDSVEGFREIGRDDVAPHLAEGGQDHGPPVAFMTRDLVAVIDLLRLFSSPKVRVGGADIRAPAPPEPSTQDTCMKSLKGGT